MRSNVLPRMAGPHIAKQLAHRYSTPRCPCSDGQHWHHRGHRRTLPAFSHVSSLWVVHGDPILLQVLFVNSAFLRISSEVLEQHIADLYRFGWILHRQAAHGRNTKAMSGLVRVETHSKAPVSIWFWSICSAGCSSASVTLKAGKDRDSWMPHRVISSCSNVRRGTWKPSPPLSAVTSKPHAVP